MPDGVHAPEKPKRAAFTTESSLTRQKAKALYTQGLSASQVANRLGVHHDTVAKWAHRGSWTFIRAEIAAPSTKGQSVIITHSPRAHPLRTRLSTDFAEFIKGLPTKCPKNPVMARAANAAWRDAATTASLIEGWSDGGNVTVNVGALAGLDDVAPAVTVDADAQVNTTDIVRKPETMLISDCASTG